MTEDGRVRINGANTNVSSCTASNGGLGFTVDSEMVVTPPSTSRSTVVCPDDNIAVKLASKQTFGNYWNGQVQVGFVYKPNGGNGCWWTKDGTDNGLNYAAQIGSCSDSVCNRGSGGFMSSDYAEGLMGVGDHYIPDDAVIHLQGYIIHPNHFQYAWQSIDTTAP